MRRSKIIACFLCLFIFVECAGNSAEVIYGDWENAGYWWIDTVMVESIEYFDEHEYFKTAGWFINGSLRVSQTAAELLEIGLSYEMKIMHTFTSNVVRVIRKIN